MESDPPTERAWWDLRGSIALVAALVFLAAAVGYFVGVEAAPGTPSSEVDEGFLRDMSHHHEQGVEMALVALARADDPVVRSFATEVLLFQQRDLGMMRAFLAERGRELGPPGDAAMGWMGMAPLPTLSMPGMASEAELTELGELEGTEFDIRFLELMRDHHLGGIHMAEYAAAEGEGADVRELADYIRRNQQIEAEEYLSQIERLQAGAP
jgi:uncharacterized protein (DUF305 family)